VKKGFIAGWLVLAASAAPALGQGKSSAAATPMSDQAFILSAAYANLAEIELGKLAETKASSEAVKDFAKRMVDDRSRSNRRSDVL
jgi:putative membrane protein